jgi:hypothetical protein
MIINAITGYSASLRSNQKTLPGFLYDIIKNGKDLPEDISTNIEQSSYPKCIEDSVKFVLNKSDDSLILVGKSMGGVKTWWMFYNYWKPILKKYKKVGILFIDPHGWQAGDHHIGSYGTNLKEFEILSEWVNKDNLRISCIYQHNKYPKGAILDIPEGTTNIHNIKLGSSADHWNITELNSESGQRVAEELIDLMKWSQI